MKTTTRKVLSRRGAPMTALAIMLFLAPDSRAESPSAHAVAGIDGDNPRIEADLLVDRAAVEAGAGFRVGVHFRMDPGWHVYWKNSGDSGFATEVDWRSDNVSFGPLQYPAPEVFVESAGMATTYGYSREVLLFSMASVAENATGSVHLQAEARFLVCRVRCIPGQARLEATIPVEAAARLDDSETVALFDRFAARLPVRPDDAGIRVASHYSVDEIRPGDSFEMSILVSPCDATRTGCPTSVGFAAAPGELAIDAPGSIELVRVGTLGHPGGGSGSQLVLRGRVLNGHAVPERIGGVLSLVVDGVPVRTEVTFDLTDSDESPKAMSSSPARADPPTGRSGPSRASLSIALGFGLLGGLILNLMPCVLPVLALKAYRIIETGGSDPRTLRMEGGAYALGVLLSMVVLAMIVLALRSIGETVGWGFQFQHPAFLAFMGALLTVFALNLFGVFEITIAPNSLADVGNRSSATVRSFFDGALAVLLATPCSAPFLGTAVGFAFAASATMVVLVFLAIGLGLALPYLAISLLPGLAAKLPRPGAWMADVRTLLGFSLLATVVWLLWIAGRSTGVDGVVWLVGLLLGMGLVTWVFGRLQNRAVDENRELLGGFVILLLGLLIFVVRFLPIDTVGSDESSQRTETRVWDPVEVRHAVEAGNVVFVDFTADWCLTCKVNERLVLSRPDFRKAKRRLHVMHFSADWTRRDDAIFEELQRHGRAGVPLYLVYSAGSPDSPTVLPEVLTIDRLLGALDRAGQATNQASAHASSTL